MPDPRMISGHPLQPADPPSDDEVVVDLVTEEAVEHGWVEPDGTSGVELHEAERRRGDGQFDEAYQHATTADLAP
jgi:hypothetical protein